MRRNGSMIGIRIADVSVKDKTIASQWLKIRNRRSKREEKASEDERFGVVLLEEVEEKFYKISVNKKVFGVYQCSGTLL